MTLAAWLDSKRKHTARSHTHTHTRWPLNDTLPQTAIMVKCDLWFDIEPVEEKLFGFHGNSPRGRKAVRSASSSAYMIAVSWFLALDENIYKLAVIFMRSFEILWSPAVVFKQHGSIAFLFWKVYTPEYHYSSSNVTWCLPRPKFQYAS